MKNATANDWRIEPLPKKQITIDLGLLSYKKTSRQKILRGFIPREMEEKWFIYYGQGFLYFHRSWTGYCIYRVFCRDFGDNLSLTHADINRDPSQYTEINDENDGENIKFLIDELLLSKPLKDFEFIRIVPYQRFIGLPAQANRPYAFYADAEALAGRTIADSYRLVNGVGLPDNMESGTKHCTPHIWWSWRDMGGDYDKPLSRIKFKKNEMSFEEIPLKILEKTKFVVLRVPCYDAIHELDVFPATWRALSYIVSDPKRMSAQSLNWNMSLSEYASASIHTQFREIQGGGEEGLLALTKSKRDLELTDLDNIPDKSEEEEYRSYLHKDSIFTSRIVDLFGISCICWHGCGYLGPLGKPIVRFFWLRNILSPSIKLSLMKGSDLLPGPDAG